MRWWGLGFYHVKPRQKAYLSVRAAGRLQEVCWNGLWSHECNLDSTCMEMELLYVNGSGIISMNRNWWLISKINFLSAATALFVEKCIFLDLWPGVTLQNKLCWQQTAASQNVESFPPLISWICFFFPHLTRKKELLLADTCGHMAGRHEPCFVREVGISRSPEEAGGRLLRTVVTAYLLPQTGDVKLWL